MFPDLILLQMFRGFQFQTELAFNVKLVLLSCSVEEFVFMTPQLKDSLTLQLV